MFAAKMQWQILQSAALTWSALRHPQWVRCCASAKHDPKPFCNRRQVLDVAAVLSEVSTYLQTSYATHAPKEELGPDSFQAVESSVRPILRGQA